MSSRSSAQTVGRGIVSVLVGIVLAASTMGVAAAEDPTTTIDTTPPTTVDTTPPTTVDTTPPTTPTPTEPVTTPPATPPPVQPVPTVRPIPNTTVRRPPTASTTPETETSTTVADASTTSSEPDTTVAPTSTERLTINAAPVPTTSASPVPLPTFEPDTSPASSSRAVSILIIALLGCMAVAVVVAARRRDDDASDAPAFAGVPAGGDRDVGGGLFGAPAPAYAPPMLAGPAWAISAAAAAANARREAEINATGEHLADAAVLPQRGLPPMVQARHPGDTPQVAALVEVARRQQERQARRTDGPESDRS